MTDEELYDAFHNRDDETDLKLESEEPSKAKKKRKAKSKNTIDKKTKIPPTEARESPKSNIKERKTKGSATGLPIAYFENVEAYALVCSKCGHRILVDEKEDAGLRNRNKTTHEWACPECDELHLIGQDCALKRIILGGKERRVFWDKAMLEDKIIDKIQELEEEGLKPTANLLSKKLLIPRTSLNRTIRDMVDSKKLVREDKWRLTLYKN